MEKPLSKLHIHSLHYKEKEE